MSRCRWAPALFCLALGLLPSGRARAELAEDAARLTNAWHTHGRVMRLRPRLAERAVPNVVFLPTALFSTPSSSCLSVVVLGPSSTHFTVRAVGESSAPESADDWPQASLAGLVQFTRCGARKSRLAALLLDMRSPRAVLEVIAVKSAEPVPSATEVLPHRDPGPIAPLIAAGPPTSAAPIAERLLAAEARAKREGAREVVRESMKSSSPRSGSFRRVLDVGCHRLELLVEPPSGASTASDLAVLPELGANTSLVAVERGDGFGAAITACVGEPEAVTIRYLGQAAEARLWLVASRYPLPQGLLDSWGSDGKAQMAALLFKNNVQVQGTPIDQALGVQGPTLMPISIEPGACYVAALTALRGEPFSMALGVLAGSVTAQNHSTAAREGTLVSFCSRGASIAEIEAESRGAGLTWLFAMWQSGRVPIGEERPQ